MLSSAEVRPLCAPVICAAPSGLTQRVLGDRGHGMPCPRSGTCLPL
jgi:hypothetical protein